MIKVALGLSVVLLGIRSTQAQTPTDASDSNPNPSIFASSGPNGSLDVAWLSNEQGLVLSTFTGTDFSQSRHIRLSKNMQLLGGLARDEAGNRYIAAFRKQASKKEWRGSYGPGVASILRVGPGDSQPTLLADLNTQQFSSLWPIVNPLRMGAKGVNAELAYRDNVLALTLGHNNGSSSNQHETGLVIGIGTDGSVQYDGGGGQHIGHTRIVPDGTDFVQAQTFDQGLGLSKLKRGVNGFEWSELILVNEIKRANQTEEALTIAGIIPTPNSYLLVFSSGKGWLWNYNNAELGTDGSCEIKLMRVSKNFDNLPKFDWGAGIKHQQGKFPVANIASPDAGKSLIRPIIAALPNGRSIVAFEQWGKSDSNGPVLAEGVRATLLDSNGDVLRQSSLFSGLRIQKNTQAIYLPSQNRIGWVSGDAQGQRLILHTLDARLSLESFELGKGRLASQQDPDSQSSNQLATGPAAESLPPQMPVMAAMLFTGSDYLMTQFRTTQEQVEQLYTVQVPYTETQEIAVEENGRTFTKTVNVTKLRNETRTRVALVPKTIRENYRYPLDAVTFEFVDGQQKKMANVQARLRNPIPVLLIQPDHALDAKYAALFSKNAIVVKCGRGTPIAQNQPALQNADIAPLNFVSITFANNEFEVEKQVMQSETRARVVTVTKYRFENGKRIPYTEQRTEEYTVNIVVPNAERFPKNALTFNSVAGKKGSPSKMAEFLSRPRPAILLEDGERISALSKRALLKPVAIVARKVNLANQEASLVDPSQSTERTLKQALAFVVKVVRSAGTDNQRPNGVSPADIVGKYAHEYPQNDYHVGEISLRRRKMIWTNSSDVSWQLEPALGSGLLKTGPDCPYYEMPNGDAFTLVFGKNEQGDRSIAGFRFQLSGIFLRAEALQFASKLVGEAKELIAHNPAAALAKYCDAIEANPISAESYHSLGVALREIGQAKHAVVAHNKALQLVDLRELYWYDRAFAFEDLDRFDEALQDLNRAIQLRDTVGSRDMRARIHSKLGNQAEASIDRARAEELRRN